MTVTTPKAMKAVIDAMFVADTVSSVIHIYQGFKYARMGAKALARAGARARAGASSGKNIVQTPHGPAVQASSPQAQAALDKVRSGSQVYRQGQFGVQKTADAQFWATQNPATTSSFANQLGMPNSGLDWMMGGTVKPGANVITRPAPGIGSNVGGAMEAVVESGGVKLNWFHMP